jgi:uncharacterized tellurite resistance protein B-like protein
MLDALKALFIRNAAPAGASATVPSAMRPDSGLRVAACALLLEMAYADSEFSDAERAHIEEVLVRHFDLDTDTARELMEVAERERRDATDLHQFTAIINRHYDDGQRMVLAELLWRVVYADGELSRHEDYLSRKIANLLELRPGFLAEAKNRARG